jgi:hypothetical protein
VATIDARRWQNAHPSGKSGIHFDEEPVAESGLEPLDGLPGII